MRTALRHRLRLIGLLVSGGPFAALLGLLFFVQALLPASIALAAGALVGRVTESAGSLPDRVLGPLAVLGGLLMIGQLLEQAGSLLRFATTRRVDGAHRAEVCRLTLAPAGIGLLAEPSVQDDVMTASVNRTGWTERSPGEAAVGQLWVLSSTLSALFSVLVVARFSWWLAAGLLVSALVVRTLLRRYNLVLANVWAAELPHARRAQYWIESAADSGVAKEARVYHLRDWLIAKWRVSELAHLVPIWRAGDRIDRRQWPLIAVTALTAFCGMYALGASAVHSGLRPAELATTLTALIGVLSFAALDPSSISMALGMPVLAAMDRLRTRLRADPRPVQDSVRQPAPPSPATCAGPPAIRFDQVRFGYPGASLPIFAELDLEIRPGEVLALVGANGAGKSTLIKLLTRQYEPWSGRITADGEDIATVPVGQWRATIAAVFQDFIRYPMSARENVAIGAPLLLDDTERITAVAREAGLAELVERLPHGWDTPLSAKLSHGVDLSGGQWQHVALARALFAVRAGARVLVLDEPTAHLDVRTEVEVFRRIVHGIKGVSVVLISHRLSTVREADRIVLLSGGRVAETGTHEELVRAGGEYAVLFADQAARGVDDQVYYRADGEVVAP